MKYVPLIDNKIWTIISYILYLSNDHKEADTLMFALCFNLNMNHCIIKSTDSDILCIACLNQDKLLKKNIKLVIQTNSSGSELKYIDVNQLFKCFDEDKEFSLSVLRNRSIPVGVVYGITHFLSGCDYLPHLRVFTKNACCHAVLKFGNHIFPENYQTNDPQLWDDEYMNIVSMNFHLALYYYKYSSCFVREDMEFWKNKEQQFSVILDKARKRTWHKTLTQFSNVPSMEALHLAGRRFLFVFRLLSKCTDLKIHDLDLYEYGWEKSSVSGQPVPTWDSMQNVENTETLLKTTLAKCGCKKSMCKTRQYSCVRRGFSKCSVLCTCTNCKIEEREEENVVSSADNDEFLESEDDSDSDFSADYAEDDEYMYIDLGKDFGEKNSDCEYSDDEGSTLM